MIIPGLVSATFKNLKTDGVISIALSSGLRAVEWSETHHIEVGNEKKARELGDMTRKEGLEVASYGSYYRLGTGMSFLPHIANAAAIGAPFIRIWAGIRDRAQTDEIEYLSMVNEAMKISEIAKEFGVPIALEWHKDTLTAKNETALEFLRDVASARIRTFWQPTRELSFEERCAGLKDVSDYVENLHVYHWDRAGRRPLSEGTEEWEKYFSLVNNRRHYALLEFVMGDSEEQFREDAEVLLGILERRKYG